MTWNFMYNPNTQQMEPSANIALDPWAKPEDDDIRGFPASFLLAHITFLISITFLLTIPTHAADLKVLDKYFYGEIIGEGDNRHRKKTTRIPNVPGKVCFGWVIEVEPSEELAKITEIFSLPEQPQIWGGVEDDPYSQTTTSSDRKTATTNRFMPLKTGTIENSWCITQGDQSGTHHIVVLYQTQVLAEFEFEVYE